MILCVKSKQDTSSKRRRRRRRREANNQKVKKKNVVITSKKRGDSGRGSMSHLEVVKKEILCQCASSFSKLPHIENEVKSEIKSDIATIRDPHK